VRLRANSGEGCGKQAVRERKNIVAVSDESGLRGGKATTGAQAERWGEGWSLCPDGRGAVTTSPPARVLGA
jgi:hypothetical protein